MGVFSDSDPSNDSTVGEVPEKLLPSKKRPTLPFPQGGLALDASDNSDYEVDKQMPLDQLPARKLLARVSNSANKLANNSQQGQYKQLIRDDLIRSESSTNVTNRWHKSINKNRKRNKNINKVRPNKYNGDATEVNQVKQFNQVKPNTQTYPLEQMKESNQKSMEPKKQLKTTYFDWKN